jgi:hypothetical protein
MKIGPDMRILMLNKRDNATGWKYRVFHNYVTLKEFELKKNLKRYQIVVFCI